jgi:hypothetical protein
MNLFILKQKITNINFKYFKNMINPKYPKPGEKWQHYKGGQYEIVCMCNHSETNEILVIYKSLSFGGFHARPFSEWYEEVDHHPNSFFPIKRFEKI